MTDNDEKLIATIDILIDIFLERLALRVHSEGFEDWMFPGMKLNKPGEVSKNDKMA